MEQRNDALKAQAHLQKLKLAVGAKKHNELKQQIQHALLEREDLQAKMDEVRQHLPNEDNSSSSRTDEVSSDNRQVLDDAESTVANHDPVTDPCHVSARPTQDESLKTLDCRPRDANVPDVYDPAFQPKRSAEDLSARSALVEPASPKDLYALSGEALVQDS